MSGYGSAMRRVRWGTSGFYGLLASEWLVNTPIRDGKLVTILRDYAPQPATTPLYGVRAPGPYMPSKTRALIDFLAERFSHDYDRA